MDRKYGSSQSENELKIENVDVPVQETKENLKPSLHNHDNISITLENKSEDARKESQSSQQYEVNKNDTYLSTAPVDYETITELQKKAQLNKNYLLALGPPVNNQILSSESFNLKRQSVSVENADYGTSNEEKQLLARYIETPKDLRFPQQLNVYCNRLINTDGSQFEDKNARHKFIRKVEFYHFLVLVITDIAVRIFNHVVYYAGGGSYKELSIYKILFWTALALLIVLSICFGCMYFIAKLFPANIIYMVFFVLLLIVCFGSFDASFLPDTTSLGTVGTVIVLLFIMVISKQNKWDITSCSFIIFMGLTVFALYAAFFVISMLITKRAQDHFYILYTGVVVSVYCMLNLFTTQIIMAYKKYEITAEDALPAAVLFYFMDFRRFVCVN